MQEEPTQDGQAQPNQEASEPQQPNAETGEAGGLRTRLRAKRQDRQAARRWEALLHNPRMAVLTGILAANGSVFLVMLLTRWLLTQFGNDSAGLFIASEFVLLPMMMGGICAYFWQEAKLSKAAYLLYGFLNTCLALLISWAFLQEGVICLLMASPLILIFVALGSFIGRKIFAARHSRLNASLAPLLLALMLCDSLLPHHFQNTETDRIVIHAPPARVWQYIIAYPANTSPPDYWLCRLGLPAPIQSTADGRQAGANRRCVFTNNIAFEEKLTTVEPNRKLEFDVVTQPNDPEVINHLTLEKGQFVLEDNHDGTTTLTGTSWYKLNVYPVCYYDWWVQNVVRHVHLRVMRHIKTLAEQK